jgi:hypothetical protein
MLRDGFILVCGRWELNLPMPESQNSSGATHVVWRKPVVALPVSIYIYLAFYVTVPVSLRSEKKTVFFTP